MNYLVGDEFLDSLGRYSNQRELLSRRLIDFMKLKTDSPHNGAAPDGKKFGDTDKRFRSGGKFTGKVDGISHAHLTHNISIVYLIRNDSLYLYGIYTHDDIGTGTPSNINRQEQMAGRWSRTEFTKFDPNALMPRDRTTPDDQAKTRTGPQPQYTPRTKPVQPANPGRAQLLALADAANSAWPQRGLLVNITNASTKEAVADIIEREVRNLGSIRNSGRTLYPNQQEYMRRLLAIAQHLSK